MENFLLGTYYIGWIITFIVLCKDSEGVRNGGNGAFICAFFWPLMAVIIAGAFFSAWLELRGKKS